MPHRWLKTAVPDDAVTLVAKAAAAAESDLRKLPSWHATPAFMGLLDMLELQGESDMEGARADDEPGPHTDERVTYVIRTLKDEVAAKVAAGECEPPNCAEEEWASLAVKIVAALDAVAEQTRAVVRLVAAERDAALKQSEQRWNGVWQLRLDLARRATVCRCVDNMVEQSRTEYGDSSPSAVTPKDLNRLFAIAQTSTHDVGVAERLCLDVARAAWRWRYTTGNGATAEAADRLTAAVDALAAQDPVGMLNLTVGDLYRSFDDSHVVEAG